ncbi:hypothetical protein G5B35_09350 [Parapusillimonas sp. SGNA-6]|jgi:ABC-type Fe3+-hydroxamate transport system substrate-binding protein|nr:hypothetical protein [Parapusillimonas sp. SGNA-6]
MKYLLIATLALVLSACGMMRDRDRSTSSTSTTSSMSYNDTYSSAVMIPDTGNGD